MRPEALFISKVACFLNPEPMASLTPKPKTYRLPPELESIVEARMEAEGYRSMSDYILALALYDCWCERPHRVTAPLFAKPQKARDKMIGQIIEEFHTKKKTGRAAEDGYFEKRMKEMAAEEAEKKRQQNEGDSKAG